MVFSNENRFRLCPKRILNDGILVHESVFNKIDETIYNPTNLNKDRTKFRVEKNTSIKY